MWHNKLNFAHTIFFSHKMRIPKENSAQSAKNRSKRVVEKIELRISAYVQTINAGNMSLQNNISRIFIDLPPHAAENNKPESRGNGVAPANPPSLIQDN